MSTPENDRGFTGFWLPSDIISAERLTWTQRLIWAEIQALQKGRLGKCLANNEHFMAVFGIGAGTVQNALTTLRKECWIRWRHTETGRELEAVYPPDSGETEFPKSGIPKSGFPKSGKKIPEIGNAYNREIPLQVPSTPKVPNGVPDLFEDAAAGPATPPVTAEAIYDAYPRKVAKPPGLRAIQKAMKSVPAEKLLELTRKYALAARRMDFNFIPHPATWFNREGWNDIHHESGTGRDYQSEDWYQKPNDNDPGI